MFSFDGTYEVAITIDQDENITLLHRFLFWKETIKIIPMQKKITMVKKGIFSSYTKTCAFQEAVIRIENDFSGGAGYRFMTKYAATIIVDKERMLVTRQNGIGYVEEYTGKLLEYIGKDAELIKIERVYKK